MFNYNIKKIEKEVEEKATKNKIIEYIENDLLNKFGDLLGFYPADSETQRLLSIIAGGMARRIYEDSK